MPPRRGGASAAEYMTLYESCVIWLSVRPSAPSYRTEPPQAPPSGYGPNWTPSREVATLAFVPEKGALRRRSVGAGVPGSPFGPGEPVAPLAPGAPVAPVAPFAP
jgi:hypothetical protein